MRIIVIVQSIIILAGAYFLYTLSRVPTPATETVPTLQPVESTGTRTGYEPPTSNPPDTSMAATTSVSSGVSGASDAGMEYPTMDASVPQVR